MPLSAKTIRSQLVILKPLLSNCSLQTARKGQNKLGELMEARLRDQVILKEHSFEKFNCAWVIPRDERRQGVILYLHGGGYTCGDLEYALGFGSLLSVETGARVFCAGYRLAPEHPFPAAVEDALEAYEYLLDKGYAASHIALCGESAGGGLCYSLCLKLRERQLPMPCGVIAVSPWTDLTASGSSYDANREVDPSMTIERLDFFAQCYTQNREDPLVSPLLGDLSGMPPSLIFAGADEIMRSDAEDMYRKLLRAGCAAQLVVAPQRWHAYLLYNLEEDQKDFATVNRFLTQYLSPERKLRWMRLDNAAKIYPAALRENWSSLFRLSATLKEDVDVPTLQSALDVTVRRFPSIAARLRKGLFWYYLEQLDHAPAVQEEYCYPLTKMSRREIRQCAFRVIAYQKRIAVEIFHCLTDGTGALIFLKSLLAEYLQQRHGIHIPAEQGVLGRLEEPSEEELEDSFQKYAGTVHASRGGTNAWPVPGTIEKDGFLHLTCFQIPVQAARAKAREYGVSLTVFLGAAMMLALQQMQAESVPNPDKRKPIKLLIPVNLRKLFPSRTVRNFAMYSIPEILPALGTYSFQEICQVIRHRMGLDVTAKQMSTMIATNVSSERLPVVKIMPLFIKNLVMKAIFDAVGEKKSCLNLSNLGAVRLPDIMMPYIDRMDFILGIQATKPNNCGVLSFGDTLYINFIRNIREPALEAHFYSVLRDMGLPVTVESNQKDA